MDEPAPSDNGLLPWRTIRNLRTHLQHLLHPALEAIVARRAPTERWAQNSPKCFPNSIQSQWIVTRYQLSISKGTVERAPLLAVD